MKKDLSRMKLGIIHAAIFTSQVVQKYIDEIIPEVKVIHAGDDTIQMTNSASEPGVIPKANYYKFVTLAKFLQDADVDLIMLACSTFNRAVEYARPMIDTPMLQIDRPMMDLAVQQGSRVGLLATLPSTVPSSEHLLRLAAQDAKKEINIKTVLCSKAFELLRQGKPQQHNEILLAEIDKLSAEVDSVIMAQVSMTALEPYLSNTRVPVYNSGRTGFTKAREILESLI